MKRSEMIEVIKTSVANEVTRAEIGEILDAAQANGMLPPQTLLYPLKLVDFAWDPETLSQSDEN